VKRLEKYNLEVFGGTDVAIKDFVPGLLFNSDQPVFAKAAFIDLPGVANDVYVIRLINKTDGQEVAQPVQIDKVTAVETKPDPGNTEVIFKTDLDGDGIPDLDFVVKLGSPDMRQEWCDTIKALKDDLEHIRHHGHHKDDHHHGHHKDDHHHGNHKDDHHHGNHKDDHHRKDHHKEDHKEGGKKH
jgi:hypothetical protein